MLRKVKVFCNYLLWIFIWFYLSPCKVKAQQRDFQGITGISIEKRISPSLSASLYTQELFNQNITELGSAFVDAGINYRVNRNVSLGANCRLIAQRNLDNCYLPRQMLYADIAYSKSLKKISFTLRGRIQNSFYPLVINETKQASVAYNRDRITLRYRSSYYLVPFLYGEIWYPLNHPTHKMVDKVRTAAGFYYNFNEHFRVEVYYSINQELNQSNKKVSFAPGIFCYFKI